MKFRQFFVDIVSNSAYPAPTRRFNMNIVERAKNICLAPTKEWEVIEGESTPAENLVGSYVAPLVALGAIAGFIGGSIIGRTIPFIGTYRVGIVPGVIGAVFVFVMGIIGVAI